MYPGFGQLYDTRRKEWQRKLPRKLRTIDSVIVVAGAHASEGPGSAVALARYHPGREKILGQQTPTSLRHEVN